MVGGFIGGFLGGGDDVCANDKWVWRIPDGSMLGYEYPFSVLELFLCRAVAGYFVYQHAGYDRFALRNNQGFEATVKEWLIVEEYLSWEEVVIVMMMVSHGGRGICFSSVSLG